jgi:hypothetical protein
MGRNAKNMEETTKEFDTINTKAEVNNEKDLATQVSELQEKLNLLMGVLSMGQQNNKVQSTSESEEEVTSLTYGILNLATEGNGLGNVYRFEEFGETQMIPITDLKLILKNNKQFALDGRFHISNLELIKTYGLTTAYKKIIKQEIFDELFKLPKNTFLKTFSEIPETQKRIFADLLVRKLYNDEELDLNIVDLVSKELNRNLQDEANSAKIIYKKVEN